MRIFTERWAAPRLRARALSAYQRLATYMVISMPNRNSVACGVSHFMRLLQIKCYGPMLLRPLSGKYRRRHEIQLMIFMSASIGPAFYPWYHA
jgi:hypothetical protein